METLFLDPFNIILLAGFIGFFMAFGIGANDVANSMGTSVGSKAITIKQAIIINLSLFKESKTPPSKPDIA